VTILNSLTPDERTLVVSLPYRAGLWVSRSDDAGGAAAEDEELRTLHSLIAGFAESVFGSELVQHIMGDLLARRSEWPGWASDLDIIPEQCRMVIDILRHHVDAKEVKAYVLRLMEIAEAVAMAYGEEKPVGGLAELFAPFLNLFKGGGSVNPRYANISRKERRILEQLNLALRNAVQS
jgi:hypothetical protein